MIDGTPGTFGFYVKQKKIGKNKYRVDWQLTTDKEKLTEADELFLYCIYQLFYGKQTYCIED